MENLLEVAQQVAVLFVMMGVGAALRRLRMLDDAAVGGMVNLLRAYGIREIIRTGRIAMPRSSRES